MNRKILYSIAIFFIIPFLLSAGKVNAENRDINFTLEEKYTQVGFKTLEESINEFQNHFKKDVALPKTTPSITFTHKFGRFYKDREYKTNDFLEIKYVNEHISENNYKLDIRPLKNKLIFKGKGNQRKYKLEDDTNAIYFDDSLFNCLVFEKNNWQYIIGIDKRVSDKVTEKDLIKIANSV
ncbi:carbon monoxide dehydrogenase [Bacillus sp. REN10]|uniref:carbon monoxide dehydrogenase n=1 Tax=Bacillus sp. REN10 TaxID=2782541 RepID=UPI00193BDADF|nr:carbon monoxide dehydrogenase [Bacillus sp. REN10]